MKEIQVNPIEHKINIHSDTWKSIDRWANERLSAFRDRLENKSLDIIKTSVIRGEIRALKEMLKLPEDK